ncbi:hypothetical protein FB451DRAFT_1557442 [Mycena latifolia]|nr:hypothetical protein FB451DRAFT_1557442 [Mycena latifolia]
MVVSEPLEPPDFSKLFSQLQSDFSRERASSLSAHTSSQTSTSPLSSPSPLSTVPASANTEQPTGPSRRPSLTAPASATQTDVHPGGLTSTSSSNFLQLNSTGASIEPISSTSQRASTQTAQPTSGPNFRRTSLSLGGIVGVVVPISMMIGLGILVFALRRRRRRRRPASDAQMVSPFMTLVSDDTLTAGPSGASSLRLEHLGRELRMARTKIAEISSREGNSTALEAEPSEEHPEPEAAPGNSSHDDEMLALRARIRELENQMHSAWALGLSDEPPPGYTA